MPVGFSKACRTCLTLDGTLISIYDSISYDGRGRVTDMIKDITKIKPMKSDGLPELVCQTCLNEINRCYSFKVKCLNSDSTLRKLFAIEEELETPIQQVLDEEVEYKPIIQNLIRLQSPYEEELEYEQPVKIKTEKDQDDQSFGYFVITSVRSQNDQTNGTGSEEMVKTFQAPQGFIKEEINYEIDSYNTSSTRRLTYSDLYVSDQSQCFDNISLELTRPQVKLELEEQFELEPPEINSTIKPSFKCPKCDKEFLYTSRLKKHMRSHNSKPFVCSTCCKGFKLSVQLRNHIDITHRNIKPFKCEECPRTFSFPSKLKEHLRSHKGSKYFKSNDYLSRTIIGKKENEEPTEFAKHSRTIECTEELKCDENAKGFITNLDVHIKEQPVSWMNERSTRRSARIHREEIKTPDSAQNQIQLKNTPSETTTDIKIKTRFSEKLTQIDYSFDSEDQHPDEKNSPEGPRQYNCPHCTKVFKYVSRLNEHMVCHSDARPFDCINCGKFFKTPGQLARHIKTSHKVSSFRGHRKAFSRRRGLKRKNVNKNFVRNKVQPDNQSLEQTDDHIIENENRDEETNVTNTDPSDDHIIENDGQTNETNEDGLDNENKEEKANETGNSLPEIEIEIKPAAANKTKPNQLDCPSKRLKQINKENGPHNSENLQTPDALQESNTTEEINTDDLRTYHCEQCDETFRVSARFYKHMRGHGIERPFICSLCGKGFKNCGNLKSHILITHKKLKPFKCNDCKRAFSCKSNLNKHLTSRIWTHSCIKEFNGRRGGSKKKIKNKKQLNIEEENKDLIINDSTNKQKENTAIEQKNENPIISDDKIKQKQQCPTEEINTKLISPNACAQEQDVVGHTNDTTNLAESESIEVRPDLFNPDTEQVKQPHVESKTNQAVESVNKKPKNRLECPQCKKVFVYVSYLKKHMQSHSDERNFICTICDKAFKYKVSLKSHNMITHAKIKPYKCDKCPQAFVNEYTYRVHRNSHNKANKRKTKTKRRRGLAKPRIVESTSTSADQSVSNLKSEVVAVEIQNDEIPCSICSISIQSENLLEHMNQYHNATESTSAPVNPTNYSNQVDNSTNSFKCPECQKVFLFASYLKKHMRSHNHERPHICSSCGKTFKDHWRLRSHIKEKHNSHSKKNNHRKKRRNLNGEKALISTDVGNVDNQDQNDQINKTSEILNIPQENLNEENNSPEKSAQEGEVLNSEIVKPQCTQCERVFQFASQLETHMRTHTGERPFVCPTCKKTFTQNGHLKNHILINHKKIMPFQCSVCLRGFASGFNMRAHEKTHFNERRKKTKSKIKLGEGDDEHFTADTTAETVQNPQDILQDQVIQDFEKLELHPLFGSMSSNQDENTSNEHNSFFPCLHCTKTFVFHSDLNEHMKTHSANARPFNCSICYKTFKQEAHLKNHTQMSHTKSRNYKCNECDREFLTFYILNKHMRSHKGKKNRSKTKSKRRYKKRVNYLQQTEYSEHLSTELGTDETNEQQAQILYNEGVTEIVNISKEQIPQQTCNVRKTVQITCALCSVAVDSDKLTDHMKQCLSISQSISIELKAEPLEDPPRMEHPLFGTLSNQDEKLIDTGIAKHCLLCKEEFCSFSLLADHMRTHNVERPFICGTCGKGFKKNAHLRSHIMIVHKRILPYKCIECSRAFSSKYNLQMHSKTHIAKINLKKGNSKRRVMVKKSYYKDPPYHAKPIHSDSADQTTSQASQQNEFEEHAINYAIENQVEQREIQFSYGRNENKIRCTLCYVSVHTENLSKHMQEFHNLPESLTCMAIKKEPLEETEQMEHRPFETETNASNTDTPRRLQCPTCDKEFIHLSRLNEHMRAHSDERPFICLVCGKTFKRHGHLTTHIGMCHKKAKPFKCKDCHQTFSNSLDLDVHMQTHNNEQLPADFHVDTNIENETNLDRPDRQNDEGLPPCNLSSERIEESIVGEAHQCTLCPTVFKSISHLMEHMKVHTSDQPFICSLCGKGFSSNDELCSHRLIRHNKSKPYQCDQCVRKFRTSLGLKKHLLIHTGNCERMQKLMQRKRQNIKHNLDLNNQESLSYSQDVPHCHICKKNFTNNWVLKEHMKCHSSEKPFVCPICEHSFSKKYNLKIHIMAHKKIKPFKCHYCPQSYCTNAGRTHHLRTHTHGRKRIDIVSFNSENITL